MKRENAKKSFTEWIELIDRAIILL